MRVQLTWSGRFSEVGVGKLGKGNMGARLFIHFKADLTVHVAGVQRLFFFKNSLDRGGLGWKGKRDQKAADCPLFRGPAHCKTKSFGISFIRT